MDTDLGGASAAGMDEAEAAFFARRGRRCCCFPWPAASHQRVGAAAGLAEEESWWQRAVLKVREWSELVAGPRWKTFIRRLRFRRGGPRHGAGGGKLNYDPLSYALNFDDGGGGPEGDDDYAGHLDFSARFVAPPPASARSSMDLGGRDAPPLFLHQAHSPRAPPAAARG